MLLINYLDLILEIIYFYVGNNIWMCADESENRCNLDDAYVHLCTDINLNNSIDVPLKLFIKFISSDYCLPKLCMEIDTWEILEDCGLNWISQDMDF